MGSILIHLGQGKKEESLLSHAGGLVHTLESKPSPVINGQILLVLIEYSVSISM